MLKVQNQLFQGSLIMIKDVLSKSKFAKNVLTLMTGTALAQIIPIAISPILTRLYSPADFSVFALYTAILSILSVIACLRFEIAIPMPENDKTALELVVLSLISTLGITALTWLIVVLFSKQIIHASTNKLDGYLWMIPVGVFLSGSYAAFQYWATRQKNFNQVAKTRIGQSISSGCAQLGFGFLGISPLGLLLGTLLQAGAGIVGLGLRFLKDAKSISHQIKISNLKCTFLIYDKFPKYSTWEALANSASIQLPVIMIATYTLGGEAGFLMLAMRLLSAPMSLIGGAVAQVFLSEAAVKHHAGELKAFTITTAWTLFKIGILPIFAIAVIAPFLIPLVFGEGWARAGTMITWMAPWFLLQFMTSPVSMSLHIANKQKVAFILQVFGVIFRVLTVYVAYLYIKDYIVEAYAISGFIFYAIYFTVVRKSLA